MNKSPPHRGADEARRLREGAEWLIRLSGGALDAEALSDEELAAWILWYEMDADNALAFEEMQTLWDGLGQLQPSGPTARDPADRKPAQTQTQRHGAPAEQRDVGVSRTLGKFFASLVGPSVSRRKQFAWSGSLLATGALGVWAILALMMAPAPLLLPPNGKMGTRLAENQEAVLPDGSTVALGAQSSLALEYDPATRHLELTNGQAYFNVAKDKTRPFAVDAGDIQIQAVGTAFDVRKNEGRVAVTVTEGVVDIITDPPSLEATDAGHVMNHSAPIRVAAGYQLIWDKGHSDGRKKTLQLSQVDTAGMTAWREGRLEYLNEPLSVVIADVSRYSSRRLVMEGTELGSLNFTGTILVDSIDDWLTAIQLSFPVSVRKGEDGSLIIRRRLAGEAPAASTMPGLTTMRTAPMRHTGLPDRD
jgi:transmembrane sensor